MTPEDRREYGARWRAEKRQRHEYWLTHNCGGPPVVRVRRVISTPLTPEARREKRNAERRARYTADIEYRANKLAKRRLWRDANPDKLREQRRRHMATYAPAWHAARALKIKLFDELLPILASGDVKALEKMRRRLVKMSKAFA